MKIKKNNRIVGFHKIVFLIICKCKMDKCDWQYLKIGIYLLIVYHVK